MPRVKTKQKELEKIKRLLLEAQKSILEAYRTAGKTSTCCESSLEDLLQEVEYNLHYTENHLDFGLLKDDLIGVKNEK